MKKLGFMVMLALAGPLVAGAADAEPVGPEPPATPVAYHTFQAVESQLARWVRKYPDTAHLETIGKSSGGRSLYVLRIARKGLTEPDRRPAVFVGANIAGARNAGTEAALDLAKRLLEGDKGGDGESLDLLLERRTFYVAPALNPDAHDGMFQVPKQRLSGAAGSLDRDLDGLVAEDGPNDLNGDGRITLMRVIDPHGTMIPDSDDPRIMVEAEALEGQKGKYIVRMEGVDDDGDGEFNEDGPGGVWPDKNFAQAFRYDDPEAGPWPSYSPEAKAIMDFLLRRRNIAVAVVYGAANNLLGLPEGFGQAKELGTLKFKIPRWIARRFGVDPEEEFTGDEVWDMAKDMPFVRRMGITKERLLQFVGAGPAMKPQQQDLKILENLAKSHKKRLEDAGLDTKRPVRDLAPGSLTAWLYYHYGALALELDVWGIPKAKKNSGKEDGQVDDSRSPKGETLTLERLEEMTPEEFVALGEETIGEFMKEVGAPPQLTPARVIQAVESGKMTPQRMANMIKSMGGGKNGKKEEKEKKLQGREKDLMAWIDAHAPEAFVPWTSVELPDGTKGEVGGIDPFIEVAPPREFLAKALELHTETILEISRRLAEIQIQDLSVEPLGGGICRVQAVVRNIGQFPTHTKMAQRARVHLPIRLELDPGKDGDIVTGRSFVISESLAGGGGALKGEWLVKLPHRYQITVRALSDNAGTTSTSLLGDLAAGKISLPVGKEGS